MASEQSDPRPAAAGAAGQPAPAAAETPAAATAPAAPGGEPADEPAGEPAGTSIVEPETVTAEVVAEPVTEEAVSEERGADELRAALAGAERERDAYLDQAQRNRAEYLNLKRRSEEQLAGALDRGAERLLGQLLGVLDNLGYVVDAAEADGTDAAQLAKGIQMVSAELFAVLESAGLEPIPGVGAAFDPQVHEALLSEESPEPVDEPVVTEVLRRGYRFKGRTLRPASVKVAR